MVAALHAVSTGSYAKCIKRVRMRARAYANRRCVLRLRRQRRGHVMRYEEEQRDAQTHLEKQAATLRLYRGGALALLARGARATADHQQAGGRVTSVTDEPVRSARLLILVLRPMPRAHKNAGAMTQCETIRQACRK